MAKKKIRVISNNININGGGDDRVDGNNNNINSNSNDHHLHDGDGTAGKKQKAACCGVTNNKVVVLKMDLHCEGCAGKIVRAVRTLDGVESVRIGDTELNKLTVIGNVDPVKLRQKVEEKTKKTVQVISPPAKQQKPSEQKSQQAKTLLGNKDDKKPKLEQLPVTTAVLKVPLHCQGCVRRIHKLVSKTKGYMEMSLDKKKELVTVKGAIDMKVLAEALQHKFKRVVEIVPTKKGSGGGSCENEKKKGGGINEEAGGKGGGEKKGGNGGEGKKDGWGKMEETYFNFNKMEEGYGGGLMEYPYPQHVYGSGYADDVHAPQLFSDENPNACILM